MNKVQYIENEIWISFSKYLFCYLVVYAFI